MEQELLDAQLQRAYQQETAEYKKYGGADGVNEDEEDSDEEDFDGDEQESDDDDEEEELDEKEKRLLEEVRYQLFFLIRIHLRYLQLLLETKNVCPIGQSAQSQQETGAQSRGG